MQLGRVAEGRRSRPGGSGGAASGRKYLAVELFVGFRPFALIIIQITNRQLIHVGTIGQPQQAPAA